MPGRGVGLGPLFRPLTRLPKNLVPLREELSIGLEIGSLGSQQPRALKSLKAMDEHRPVRLSQHVFADFDREVRPYPQDLSVEGGMMKLAHRKTVGNDREAPRMSVREDMSRVEEL